jgi:hypothetical protein
VCVRNILFAIADKKKTTSVVLVEEDIAKLRYEVVYLQELLKKKKLTMNRLVKRFKRIDFTKIQVCGAPVIAVCDLFP